MSEAIIVTDSEPEATPAAIATAFEQGKQSAELETLTEKIEEAEAATETAEAKAESAANLAEAAIESNWSTRAEVEELRSEMRAGFAEILDQLREDEDDQPEAEAEIVDDSPEAEPTPEAPEPKTKSILSRIVYGR